MAAVMLAAATWLVLTTAALAKTPPPVKDSGATGLPAPIAQALRQARVPLHAASFYVAKIGEPTPQLAVNDAQPMSPASTMKLVTTYSGLKILRPDYRWRTALYTDGQIANGTLVGNVYVLGSGDPKLVPEDLEKMLSDLRGLGVQRIQGDLVLDKHVFAPDLDNGTTIDGENLRAYNVSPDALLYAFKTVRFIFSTDPLAKTAQVDVMPPLAQLAVDNQLRFVRKPCTRAEPQPQVQTVADGTMTARFAGTYAAACGTQETNLALFSHNAFFWGGFVASWRAGGGQFERIPALHEGRVPANARLLVTHDSPPLVDIVTDINKFSNNVMARQLFLTLGIGKPAQAATTTQSANVVYNWLAQQHLKIPELVIVNGSGLSHQERISAASMGHLLEHAQSGPDGETIGMMLMQSLPIVGVDGTMKHRLMHRSIAGNAYIKTGTLEGVRAIAGYVNDFEGNRFVVVSFINHPNAPAARAAHDALLQWVYNRQVEPEKPAARIRKKLRGRARAGHP